MFKNDEPPVSLFSFQDIITTLTGIMIFFLLILVISMLEITESASEETPVYTEWREVEKQNQLLQAQNDEIKNEIRGYRQRLMQIAKMSAASLAVEKKRLQQQQTLERKRLQKIKQESLALEQELKVEETRNANAVAEKKRLERELQKKRMTEQQIAELRKKIKDLEKEIAERKKMVDISLDRRIDKIPLLIECSRNAINVVNLSSREVKKISRQSPLAADMLKEMIAYLKKFPISQYYFVFLIKPGAADYQSFISDMVRRELRGAKYGMEPILENEACY